MKKKLNELLLALSLVLTAPTLVAQMPAITLPAEHIGVNFLFSPNEKTMISTTATNLILVWDVSTGKLIKKLNGHSASINDLLFISDYELITASDDNAVIIWDIQKGEIKNKLLGHTSEVKQLVLYDNNTKLLSFGNNGCLIWNLLSNKVIGKIDALLAYQVSLSYDGKYVAISSGKLSIWDLTTFTLVKEIEDENWFIRSAQFAPNDYGMYIEYKDYKDKKDKLIVWLNAFKKKAYSINNVSRVVLGKRYTLEISEQEKKVRLMDVNGNQIKELTLDSPICELSPTEDYFSIGTTIYDSKNGNEFTKLESSYGRCSFSSKGQYAVIYEVHSWASVLELRSQSIKSNLEVMSFIALNKIRIANGNLIAHMYGGATGHFHLLRHIATGVKLRTIQSSGKDFSQFNTDSSMYFELDKKRVSIFEIKTNSQKIEIPLIRGSLKNIAFTPSGKYIVQSSYDSTFINSIESGKLKYKVGMPTEDVYKTKDNLVLGNKNSVKIFNIDKMSFEGDDIPLGYFSDLKISPSEKHFTSYYGGSISLFQVAAGKKIYTLKASSGKSTSFIDQDIQLSPSEDYLLSCSDGGSAKLMNLKTEIIKDIPTNSRVQQTKFLTDSTFILTTEHKIDTGTIIHRGHILEIWDVNLNLLSTIQDLSYEGTVFHLGKDIIYETFLGQIKSINANSNNYTLNNRKLGGVFSKESLIVSSLGNTVFLGDLKSGKDFLSWTLLDSANWVVQHPSGLFDASPGAMNKLYFVQGLDIIDFNQLKERYYEPGLWKKVMAGEALRNVVGFKSIDLPPDIQVGEVDNEGYLPIQLTNRGGGIGEVNLFLNGKEIIKDARDANVKPDADKISLKVFVGRHKSIVKGQENLIAVKAWNKDHWVVSRGQVIRYHSKEIEQYKPAVHILSCGVSDYSGNEIDLKYAAKDAIDVSRALQLGAKKLFGTERSFVYTLTTSETTEKYPTKVNILKTFENISATAHPLDVFVMYISGHGINYGGQDGDWHYLTQEAYTGSASAYNDPAIRQQTTISSNELVELFKKVPALKQVLMIDACASGKVVDNLIAQKDIESSTLRALDRMRDRTGMHIITGCTADAVSYEASKYGQGVLTYSLLEGIRGAALRDEQYVDVNKLFQYAQDRVPKLAEGIGGIQSPQVFSPQGSQSFDIGLLTDVEKKEVPIARIRPVYVRSNFQDAKELEDVLNLSKLVDESLNEVSSKGVDSQIIFVDVREYPDGCKLSGSYKKENGNLLLSMKKRCGPEVKTFELKAIDAQGLRSEVLKML